MHQPNLEDPCLKKSRADGTVDLDLKATFTKKETIKEKKARRDLHN